MGAREAQACPGATRHVEAYPRPGRAAHAEGRVTQGLSNSVRKACAIAVLDRYRMGTGLQWADRAVPTHRPRLWPVSVHCRKNAAAADYVPTSRPTTRQKMP